MPRRSGSAAFLDIPSAIGIPYNVMRFLGCHHGHLMPKEFALLPSFPNPFNPSTTIRYQLPRDQEVRLSVYGLTGQLVRELVHARRTAGYHSATWDGRNGAASLVANGVYLYEIRTGDFHSVRKMMLVK